MGNDEYVKNQISVKNLVDHTQKTIPYTELLEYLKV